MANAIGLLGIAMCSEALAEIGIEFKRVDETCLHDQCPECQGTGVKKDGNACVHMILCPCLNARRNFEERMK